MKTIINLFNNIKNWNDLNFIRKFRVLTLLISSIAFGVCATLSVTNFICNKIGDGLFFAFIVFLCIGNIISIVMILFKGEKYDK
jgi:uncharacterized membrane protein